MIIIRDYKFLFLFFQDVYNAIKNTYTMKDLMTRQKRIMFTFFFVLILAATRSSAQDNPMFRHLPPNATFRFHVNIPVITAR